MLGRNFFQDSPEFAADLQFDVSGYFISRHWWENADTVAVMSLGNRTGDPYSGCGNYAKGLLAYDAWKEADGKALEALKKLNIAM